MSSSQHVLVKPTYTHHSPLLSSKPVKRKERTPSPSNMDPDMRRIMENENTFKAAKTQHVPTKEEQTLDDKSGISWVMIVFAIIIVALVCAIMWLVLRYNKKEEPEVKQQIIPPRVQFANPVAQNPPRRPPKRTPPVVKEESESEEESDSEEEPESEDPPAPTSSESKDESKDEPSPKTETKQKKKKKELVVVKNDVDPTLCDPEIDTATENELFEVLEGNNKKYAKKKKLPKKKSSPETAEEDEMTENYYNEIQDSDEEDFDNDE